MKSILIFIIGTLLCAARSENYLGDSCTIRNTNEIGRCMHLRKCNQVIVIYNKSKIRPTRCADDDSSPVVCCPSYKKHLTVPSAFNPNRPGLLNKRISYKKCEEYSWGVHEVDEIDQMIPGRAPEEHETPKCTFSNTPVVVGGTVAAVGEFPHMAVLGWRRKNTNEFEWKCGGSLISEKFVLTAAHCLSPSPDIVRLGEHNLIKDDDGAEPQDIRINRTINHPEYSTSSVHNDIALIELEYPARLGKFVRPACLTRKWNFENITKGVVTGWGSVKSGSNKMSDELMKVSVEIFDHKNCSSIWNELKDTKKLEGGITRKQFCAAADGKDACKGDSGGPIQVSRPNNACVFYIIGVTSTGKNCAIPDTTGLYIKVSKYVDWIEKTVWPNEKSEIK